MRSCIWGSTPRGRRLVTGEAGRGQGGELDWPLSLGSGISKRSLSQSWQGADVNKAKISILTGRVEISKHSCQKGPGPSLGFRELPFTPVPAAMGAFSPEPELPCVADALGEGRGAPS